MVKRAQEHWSSRVELPHFSSGGSNFTFGVSASSGPANCTYTQPTKRILDFNLTLQQSQQRKNDDFEEIPYSRQIIDSGVNLSYVPQPSQHSGDEDEDSINNDSNNNIGEGMAVFSSSQLFDIIPKYSDEYSVEQFIAIVDNLLPAIPEAQKILFMTIVKTKITGKAFRATKGQIINNWAEMKEVLTTNLEEKLDVYSTQ